MTRLPLLVGLIALPAWAQEPGPQPQTAALLPVSSPSAIDVLMQQAQRWLDQGRPDLAELSAQRALLAQPRNPQALLLALRIAAANNKREEAAAYAARLRSAGATPEQLATADNELRAASLDHAAIEQARRLERESKPEEAAAAYRAAFGQREPPALYAREYYQALAATSAGREAGQRAISQLAAQPGADDQTLLANAEQLTYTPATRADGIRRLAELAGKPDVATEAQRAWKQALGFNATDPSTVPLYEDYLRRFPGDADVQRQLEAARAEPPAAASGLGEELRQRGFAELQSGGLQSSAKHFEDAIALNPKDADALGGLGIVRLREKRPAEARSLLERAVAADSAKAGQWHRALDGANYTLELAEAQQDLRRGDTGGAEAILRRAVARDVDDTTDAHSMLGEALLRRGDAAEAEQHFRAALASRPRFAPAVMGLAQALRKQGRVAEANALRPPAPPAAAAPAEAANPEVARLRAQAASSSDPREQANLLNSAMSLAPSDPYLRLDLARALRRIGQEAQGRAMVDELAERSSTADANYAAALFAQETGRAADAEAFLARIPPQRRNADMARLAARVHSQSEVARAAALLPSAPAEARRQLVALAARPDPTGAVAADAIRDLANAGDSAGADEAARAAEAANPAAGADIAIAGALLAVGLDAQASAVAVRAEAGPLTQTQQRDLASLKVGTAIRASDRLNEQGKQAAAYESLRPALSSNPDEPAVKLALARLYQGASRPAEAQRIAEAILARDTRDWDARQEAVEAALASGDRSRAEALANEGRALAPNDSRAMLLQARVARATGNSARARALLEQAAAQRDQELGRDAGSTLRTVPGGPVNPFAGLGGASVAVAETGDPLSREIGQELQLAQLDTAPQISAGGLVRVRSGVAGLDSLTEIGTPLEASGAVGNIGGRFIARVTPTFLDSGSLNANNSAEALRFGTNALAAHSVAPSDTTASGAGLNLAYQRGDAFAINVGSSPLGFQTTNILGGIEIAPRLSDAVRLRLEGQRSMVQDSLLSYAGEGDPLTGRTWGGVTQSGGRAQIETALGAGSAYVLGGYAILDGENVARNTRREAGAGFSYPVWKQGNSVLSTGLDLVYFAYDNNQRGFTWGQGGYFSPQNYVALSLPVDYHSNIGKLDYKLGGTLGYAHFRENASPLFPTDATMQAQVEAESRLNSLIPTTNQGQTKNEFTGGLRVELTYPLTENLSLIGTARYDKAADYDETRVSVRLQNQF